MLNPFIKPVRPAVDPLADRPEKVLVGKIVKAVRFKEPGRTAASAHWRLEVLHVRNIVAPECGAASLVVQASSYLNQAPTFESHPVACMRVTKIRPPLVGVTARQLERVFEGTTLVSDLSEEGRLSEPGIYRELRHGRIQAL